MILKQICYRPAHQSLGQSWSTIWMSLLCHQPAPSALDPLLAQLLNGKGQVQGLL